MKKALTSSIFLVIFLLIGNSSFLFAKKIKYNDIAFSSCFDNTLDIDFKHKKDKKDKKHKKDKKDKKHKKDKKDKNEDECTCKSIKPIDSLTMEWTGDSTQVTLMNGEVIQVENGDIITESGLAGLGNDIIWQVGNGKSKFHVSCSDKEMNDYDDVGKLQGNGKKDDDRYINKWKFVDMGGVDGSTLEDCGFIPEL